MLKHKEINSFFIIFNGKSMGVEDKNKNVIIPCEYENIVYHEKRNIFLVKKNDKYGLIDSQGKVICPCKYLSINPFSSAKGFENGFEIRGEKGVGWLNDEGCEVIPPRFYNYGRFQDRYVGYLDKDSHCIIFNEDGKQINEKDYLWVKDAHNRFFYAYPLEGWALFSPEGKQLTEFIFGDHRPFVEGLSAVNSEPSKVYETHFSDGRVVEGEDYSDIENSVWVSSENPSKLWGVINEQGKTVIPFIYTRVNNFSEGLAVVEKDGKFGYIDKNGKVAIPIIYESCTDMKNGFATVQQGDKAGLINNKGEFLWGPNEGMIGPWKSERGLSLIISDEGGFGYTDLKKDYTFDFHEKEGRFVFQDADGNLAPITNLEDIQPLIDDSQAVAFKGKAGMIDGKGHIIIPCEFEGISSSFWGGIGFVQKDGKYAFIKRSGEQITPFEYDEAGFIMKGYCVGKKYSDESKHDFMGLVSAKGDVGECKYDYITRISSDFSKYNKERKRWEYPTGAEWTYYLASDDLGLVDQLNNRLVTRDFEYSVISPANSQYAEPHFINAGSTVFGLDGKPLERKHAKDHLVDYSLPRKEIVYVAPEILKESKIEKAKNKFNKNYTRAVSDYYLYEQHEDVYDNLRGYPLRFLCALEAAVSEWILLRLSQTCQQYVNLEYAYDRINALYAGSVNPSYVIDYLDTELHPCETNVPNIKDLDEKDQDCLCALDELVYTWGNFFSWYGGRKTNAHTQVVGIIVLARMILSGKGKDSFNTWLEDVLKRGEKCFGRMKDVETNTYGIYNVYLDPLVPREFFWDSEYVSDMVKDEELVIDFLSKIDWDQNPYLDKTVRDKMPIYGFKG